MGAADLEFLQGVRCRELTCPRVVSATRSHLVQPRATRCPAYMHTLLTIFRKKLQEFEKAAQQSVSRAKCQGYVQFHIYVTTPVSHPRM